MTLLYSRRRFSHLLTLAPGYESPAQCRRPSRLGHPHPLNDSRDNGFLTA
ncbi:hypothetical protein HMPREF9599_01422 [Cutibacterium acnes HL050PA2]|nr:hypothetical protein HMPREF9599_01422 [Cutibacterium acnes HL050PA2]